MDNKEEILNIANRLSKYYNNEIIEYLYSVINLEISVFSNPEFNSEFIKTDFSKIVYYNIINRALETIKRIDGVKEEKLHLSTIFGDICIFYKNNEKEDFTLLQTNYNPQEIITEKPVVILKEIESIKPGNLTYSLKKLSNFRRDLTNEVTNVLLNDWNIEYTEEDKPLFTSSYVKELTWVSVQKNIL